MKDSKISGDHAVVTNAEVRIWEPTNTEYFTLIIQLPNGENVWATVQPRANKSFKRLEDFVELVRKEDN